ncbi:hypothetical protein [Streptomyces werraensis]|uniref:hypothetical protein n=1 Tax=Streptomyces werraensis TaxID=68284 RepID=UPI0037D32F46
MSAAVIAGDAEALAVARGLADEFRKGAAERDAGRRLPHQELERLSASKLLGVTVPAAARTWTRAPSRARWKVHDIGRCVLNGTRPPRHGLL